MLMEQQSVSSEWLYYQKQAYITKKQAYITKSKLQVLSNPHHNSIGIP